MPSSLFALVDCNNFYVSCERVFSPDLEGRPVIILSNNDGCAVARSNEAKALGIKMGQPVYQIRSLIQQHGVVVLSSNYKLYADMSWRVISILKAHAPRTEVYSIDECFLDVGHMAIDIEHYVRTLRDIIKQYTGIPVSVGVGESKTLAKAANYLAKKHPHFNGVCQITSAMQRMMLKKVPIDEVWGVGRRYSQTLTQYGIQTADDLASKDNEWVRQRFNVVLARTALELSGQSCLTLDAIQPAKKSIVVSRSFGQKITTFSAIREAVHTYAARACEKLRQQHSVAGVLMVFIQTNRFSQRDAQYHNSITSSLVLPTNDTRDILQMANHLLKVIYKDGYAYHKAGVMLLDIAPIALEQKDFYADHRQNSQSLMQAMDELNQRFGKQSLYFASQAKNPSWRMRQGQCTPEYTTNWQHIPIVK